MNKFFRMLLVPFLSIGVLFTKSSRNDWKLDNPYPNHTNENRYKHGKHNGSHEQHFNKNLRKRRKSNKKAKQARKINRERR